MTDIKLMADTGTVDVWLRSDGGVVIERAMGDVISRPHLNRDMAIQLYRKLGALLGFTEQMTAAANTVERPALTVDTFLGAYRDRLVAADDRSHWRIPQHMAADHIHLVKDAIHRGVGPAPAMVDDLAQQAWHTLGGEGLVSMGRLRDLHFDLVEAGIA